MGVARRDIRVAARVRRGRSTVRVGSLAPLDTDQDPVAGVTRCVIDALGVDPAELEPDRPLPKLGRESFTTIRLHRRLAERMGVDASLVIGAELQWVPVGARGYRIDMTDLRSAPAAERERDQYTVAGWILAGLTNAAEM